MRRKFSFQSEEEEGVDMTPMLDIVFVIAHLFHRDGIIRERSRALMRIVPAR